MDAAGVLGRHSMWRPVAQDTGTTGSGVGWNPGVGTTGDTQRI